MGGQQLIQKGDIFLLKKGDMVYGKIPERFSITNRPYSWKLNNHETKIGEHYYSGEYLAIRCSGQGGGTGHGLPDGYPDGWHVKAVKIAEKEEIGCCEIGDIIHSEEITFYQSGCFTAMITRNIEIVGKASMKWDVKK